MPQQASRAFARALRLHALRMTSASGASHVGSAFSCADIVATLYTAVLNVDPSQPDWPARDRFVLSKGHAGSVVYAALAERGFWDCARLETYYRDGTLLGGHISHKQVSGVEVSTGSLGHGLPIAAGMAYSAQLDSADHRIYVLLSDGECDEGTTWEAALFGAHHRLACLAVIVDYNKIQSLAPVDETLALEPLADKWRAFGWRVIEMDGHDHTVMSAAFQGVPDPGGRPTCFIAHTTKGKGVSFMENSVTWHYRTARGSEFEAALAELEVRE